MATTIEIAGLGFQGTVEVQEGEGYCDALKRAGFANPDELDVTVDGVDLEGEALRGAPVTGGANVAATPKNAALGH